MSRVSFTVALREAQLAALKAVGGPLAAPTLMLIKAAPTKYVKSIAIGDLTEADFPGYAASAGITFAAPYSPYSETTKMDAPAVEFTRTGGGAAQDIYGYAFVNVGKTTLYYVHLYEEPVPVNGSGQSIVVKPEVVYGE